MIQRAHFLHREIVLMLILALLGCARNDAPDATAPPSCVSEAPVVDPVLLSFLSKARAVHHRVDLFEEQAETERAISELSTLIDADYPGPLREAPEFREVIADSLARRAEIRSQTGDFARAAHDVDVGLNLAEANTHFRGHLLEIRGVVEERRSVSLKQAGQTEESKAARERAVKAFEEAIAVQDEVIRRALSQHPAAKVPSPSAAPAPR